MTERPDHIVEEAFTAFRPAVLEHFTPPPLPTPARPARHRWVAVTAAAIAVAALVVGIVVGTHRLAGPKPQIVASPSPSATPLTEARLGNSVIDLPSWQYAPDAVGTPQDCNTSGKLRFSGGVAQSGGSFYRISGPPSPEMHTRVPGPVWLVQVSCRKPSGDITSGEEAVLVLSAGANGALRGLGYLAPHGSTVELLGVGARDGDLVVDLRGRASNVHTLVQRRVYRWTGSTFQQVAGPMVFPASVAVAQIEPENWTYTVGGIGGDVGNPPAAAPGCPLLADFSLSLLDGAGSAPVHRPPADTCGQVTGALIATASGTLPNLGDLRLATIRVTVAGTEYVGLYAMYEYKGEINTELLLPGYQEAPLTAAGNPEVAGNAVQITAGGHQYRWRWISESDGSNLYWSFQRVP